MNIASDLMLEEVSGDRRQKLLEEITGPFRTMGSWSQDPDLVNAPAWWRGEDEAYQSTMSALTRLPARGRRRRR